jgi:hypothetical protein
VNVGATWPSTLLRESLVQAGQHQDDGPARVGGADAPQRLAQRAGGEVLQPHRDEDEVRLRVERGDVLGGVVARLVDAAGVEEYQRGAIGGREREPARRAGAGSEAVADLGVGRAGEELDEARLARLRLAEQPEDRGGRAAAQLVELRLQRGRVHRRLVRRGPQEPVAPLGQPPDNRPVAHAVALRLLASEIRPGGVGGNRPGRAVP